MILLTKKVLFGGIITLFASCSAYNGSGWSVQNNSATSISLDDWSLENNTSTPIHTCDSTTHTHETFVTHHENYDKYLEYCINKETKDCVANENFIYHDEMNAADLNSSSHNINNPDLTPSHDPLSDFTLEARKQGIEENQIAQIEEHNKDFQTTGKIICELSIPKGRKLYLRDVEGRTFDSTLILEKVGSLDNLINALASPIIQARFQRITCTTTYTEAERKFLNALTSRQVTQLLSQLKHPDLNIAQSAFNELKQLWPWKREHTFLGPDLKYGTGEPGFTANIGVDIMKIAEKSLITRPDYIAKHANAQEQKTIQEYREKCYLLQQEGNNGALSDIKQQLYLSINKNGNKNDLATNVCFAIAENCYLDPITTIFRSIIHEPSLEKACDHLKNLEKQIVTQAEQHNIIPMSEVRTWVIDHYGFDVLDAAQNRYRSRADYVYTPNNQSYLSDTIKFILTNIESKNLQGAHAELVNLDKQLIEGFKDQNIINPIAQKEYMTRYFGTNVLEAAHKKYEARSDHKNLVESFMAIDVNQATVTILENNNSYESVANEMSDLAKCVFVNGYHCNLDFLPKVESHVYGSIDAMRIAQDHPTFIFNFSMVHHTLGDIQQLAHAILSGTHPVLERSSELLTIGLGAFFKGLNPITQISNMGHLASDLGSILKKGGAALWNDPIAVIHNGITTTFTLTELIRNTADFISDLTVGKLYLSPEEYKQRTDAFCAMMELLQGVTGDQCAVFIGQLAADIMFLDGLGNAYTFLKEIDVLEKLGKSAAAVAHTFKKGFDTHLANNPIVVTTEGITIRMSNDLKNVGEKIKNSSIGQKVILRVNNMKEFFSLPFGQTLQPHSLKTSYQYQKFSIYKLTENIPNTRLKKGYFYYLDRLHGDHLEVFDKQLKVAAVYNLDGTFNMAKFEAARKAGRTIKLT